MLSSESSLDVVETTTLLAVQKSLQRAHRYRAKPVEFIYDRCEEEPWSIQRDIARSVLVNRQVAVPSCFGSGKDWIAARLALWWVATGGVCVATGNTFTQLREQFWRELRRAHKRARLPGNPSNGTDLRWELDDFAFAIARKPDDNDPEGLQGTHAERVMVIIDEANGVAPDLWDAVKGLVVNAESRILAIGNPFEPNGPFFDSCRLPTWTVIPISVFDTPNFHCACGARYTAESTENGREWAEQHVDIHGTWEHVPAIAQKALVGPVWLQDRKDEGLQGTPWWQAKVLGQFPDTASNAIIPLAWVEAARARPHVPDAREWAGLDVARYGSDDTVLVTGSGNGFEEIEVVHGQGTMETAGMGIRYLNARRGSLAVDVIGVGSGVVDRIKEQRPPGQLLAVNVGENADREPELLQNLRAQVWWDMRRALDPATDDGLSLARLPEQTYQRLRSELTAPTYRFTSSGKVQIESKEELAKRGVSSPDVADAACLALYARSRARRRVTFGAAA